jgi:hypothetical protein
VNNSFGENTLNMTANPRSKGSRGQSRNPLLLVTELMLPPLSALRAQLYSAPVLPACRWILAAFLGLNTLTVSAAGADESLLGALPGDQDFPSLSINADGGFVTWEDNRVQAGKEGKGIAAVALGSNQGMEGEPFRVSEQTEGRQERPQVVRLSGGEHLFVWEVRQGRKAGVYARSLGTNGEFAAVDQLISVPTVKQTLKQTTNWTAYYRGVLKSRKHKFKDVITHTREQAGAASVVALPDGGAVVVYHAMRRVDTNSWFLFETNYVRRGSDIQDSLLRPFRTGTDWMHDIFMQRLDSAGRKVGDVVQVNQNDPLNQRTPTVSLLANGQIVVVWVSESRRSFDWRANFRVNLAARVFDAQGQPATDEFGIESADHSVQANPAVSGVVGGGFLVLWSQQERFGGGWDVLARAFDVAGVAGGAGFRVNAYTTGDQFGPKIATTGDAQLIVWTSIGQDGSREGVFGRRLQAGALAGDEFRINQTTASRQWHPAVAADGQGGAVVLWSGFVGASGFDLFGGRTVLNSNPPAN